MEVIPDLWGEEPRDVAKPRDGALHVAALPKRQHLVDPHAAEPVAVGLDRVEQGNRLAVGQADDEIRALLDPLENRLWGAPSAGERGG
jgi:hypothetical protein